MKNVEADPIKIPDNQVLSKYIEELANDLKLDEFNLREKSLMCSSIWSKWLSYLYLEKNNLERIQKAKQKILQKKAGEIKVTDSLLRSKAEEKLADNDETIKKLNVLGKNTQTNIDYIERALGILQNFGFSIKNTIEILKLGLLK